jgi:RNA polymerase-binding transcription factor DksA
MCDVCGDPIPPGRLRALPDAVLCLRCADAQRRGSPPRRR